MNNKYNNSSAGEWLQDRTDTPLRVCAAALRRSSSDSLDKS